MNITKAFLVLSLVSASFACSCVHHSITEHYCDSAFVGILKVVSGPKPCGESLSHHNCYKVEKIKMFKGDDSNLTEISTREFSEVCGRSYDINTEYLIMSSSVTNGFINTHLCEYQRVWSYMTDNEKIDSEAELRKIKCLSEM